MDHVNIRHAKNEDARGILEAHYSAVHDTASADYPDLVRGDWAPEVTYERIEKYLLESFCRAVIVVAELNGCVAGYSAIVVAANELRDLYVSARFGRKGIGSALLRTIERLANEGGCTELHLNATLTARGFYLRHGYSEIELAEFTFDSGRKAACVRMRKELGRALSPAHVTF